jgi:uncharacterized RDD family membrane protein YckC
VPRGSLWGYSSAMPLPQPEDAVGDWPLATFWRRVAAAVIDHLVLVLPFLLLARIHPLLALALPIAYGTYFESSKRPATPGKRLCGIEVMTLASAHPPLRRALARNALKYCGYGFLASGWGYVVVLAMFAPVALSERRGLHDRIAGTVVRHEPKRGISPLVVGVIATVVPLLFVTGMLPLLTAPYYAEQARRQVLEALAATRPYQAAVEKYYALNNKLPDGLADIGMEAPAAPVSPSFTFSRGRIAIEPAGMRKPGTITQAPQATGTTLAWKCSADGIPNAHLPPQCRGE